MSKPDSVENMLIKSHACKIEGCNNLSNNVEYCPKHAYRIKKYGRPDKPFTTTGVKHWNYKSL